MELTRSTADTYTAEEWSASISACRTDRGRESGIGQSCDACTALIDIADAKLKIVSTDGAHYGFTSAVTWYGRTSGNANRN
jgi:hypothetical protein